MRAKQSRTHSPKSPRAARSAAANRVIRKRILVVDDHPMLRAGLADLINNQPDMQICGQAASAAEGLDAIQRSDPDLVVTDITMPGRSGVEFLKDALAINPNLPILVLSMHDEMIYAERALHAGARGYVMKKASPDVLLTAIYRVLAGQVYVSEHLSIRLLDSLTGRPPPRSRSLIETLSDREFEVFRLLGEGLATAAIGSRLNLSAKTVATHRINIKAKLGLDTASELISCAAKWASADAPSG